MSKFNVGDVVYLNSGSPPMTVEEAQSTPSDNYTCCWSKSDGAVVQAEFNERCITKEVRLL